MLISQLMYWTTRLFLYSSSTIVSPCERKQRIYKIINQSKRIQKTKNRNIEHWKSNCQFLFNQLIFD